MLKDTLRIFAQRHREGTTWIYAIQAGANGPIKIGTTDDPRQRLKTLQTGNPERLRGIALWRGTREDEQGLHAAFAEARLEGEWFSPTRDLLDSLFWLDRASCEWHPPDECIAGAPGLCMACGVEFW